LAAELDTPALTLHNGTNSSVESLFTPGRQIQLHEQTVNPSAAQMQGDRERVGIVDVLVN
jgi:hypothetical protein